MKFGLTVVVLALMGAILAGSISFDSTPILKTEYDRITDLAPIVTYSSVDSDELYNPVSNQTGWTNVLYTTQDSPSIYSVIEDGTYESWTAPESLSTYAYQGHYFESSAGSVSAAGSFIVWNDGSNGIYPAENMTGGNSGQTQQLVTSTNHIYQATWNVTVDGGQPLAYGFVDLTHQAATDNWSNIVLNFDDKYCTPAELQFTSNGDVDQKVVTLNLQRGSTEWGTRYFWDQSRSGWYRITGVGPNNVPTLGDSPVNLYSTMVLFDHTITGEQFVPGNRTYITPYSEVTIGSGETATWSNGYQNSRIQILADPTAIVTATDGSATLTINLPPEAQSYNKVLITIGASTGDRYWQGITNYVSPTDYTLLDYHYAITGGAALNHIDEITVSGSSMAYLANTWVPTDPSGLLWQDPVMAPADYFPALMAADARIIFSSILVTGESLTINGQTYLTSDKSITIDGRNYRLNGFAVDYQNGHTYLNTPTGERFDIGVTTSTEISGSGVWFWSAELDSINTVSGEQTNIQFGQAPTANWSIFAFVGLIGLGLIGAIAIGRSSLDGYDWIIMIVAAVIALMLVTT